MCSAEILNVRVTLGDFLSRASNTVPLSVCRKVLDGRPERNHLLLARIYAGIELAKEQTHSRRFVVVRNEPASNHEILVSE